MSEQETDGDFQPTAIIVQSSLHVQPRSGCLRYSDGSPGWFFTSLAEVPVETTPLWLLFGI